MLRSTDIYVLIGALSSEDDYWSLRDLAVRLHIDHTVVHRALKHAQQARLYEPLDRHVNRAGFEELAIHAARFIAPAPLGAMTRGFRAAWAVAPISKLIRESAGEPPPVWPSALGVARGQALQPLHPSAIEASADPAISGLLSIVDSLRAGDLRVREVAATALREQLRGREDRTESHA